MSSGVVGATAITQYAVRFAEGLRKLAQSSDLKKNMDQWRDREQCRTNN